MSVQFPSQPSCEQCIGRQWCRNYFPVTNCSLLKENNINDIAGVQLSKGYRVVSRTIPLSVPLPQFSKD